MVQFFFHFFFFLFLFLFYIRVWVPGFTLLSPTSLRVRREFGRQLRRRAFAPPLIEPWKSVNAWHWENNLRAKECKRASDSRCSDSFPPRWSTFQRWSRTTARLRWPKRKQLYEWVKIRSIFKPASSSLRARLMPLRQPSLFHRFQRYLEDERATDYPEIFGVAWIRNNGRLNVWRRIHLLLRDRKLYQTKKVSALPRRVNARAYAMQRS